VQTQAITVELRLPGLAVWGVEEREDAVEVVAQYAATDAECPRCQQPTWQVHQTHRQYKRDAQLWGKQVWILIWKRRFRCRRCRYVFMEPDPSCGRRRRTTHRLRETVARQAEDATVRTVSRWHAVSEGLVQRGWLEAHLAPAVAPTPHVLIGLDGFCVRRPARCGPASGTSRRGILSRSSPASASWTCSACSNAMPTATRSTR